MIWQHSTREIISFLAESLDSTKEALKEYRVLLQGPYKIPVRCYLSHCHVHLSTSAQGVTRRMLIWQHWTEALIPYEILCYSLTLLHLQNCDHGIHSDGADRTPALRSLGYSKDVTTTPAMPAHI